MEHTKPNDCYTNIFGCESQVNIILLEFRSGWLSVSSSLTALASSSKIITNMDFRDLSFEWISFLLYLCSNRRSPLGLRELKQVDPSQFNKPIGRSPLGLRELKRLIGCNYFWWRWVAARLGCVNWNTAPPSAFCTHVGRSPLGLRELKLCANVGAFPQISSQPAWAAWIETIYLSTKSRLFRVAARLGCVNWNWWAVAESNRVLCRSPLGLRELKHNVRFSHWRWVCVAARLGCVNWN